MRVLITGANGQLGTDLVSTLSDHHQIFGFGRQQLDITDLPQVLQVVQQIKPDAVIHAAAYTQVDEAESNQDRAYLANTYGTRNLAAAAQKVGAKLVYISTDYVFDGQSSIPYKEFDRTNPLSVYGKSKLAGEEMVKTLSDKYFIVRTSWLFGKHGHNFVNTMLKLAQLRNELSVVYDQTGSPTYSPDLAQFLKDLLVTDKYGIYHASNTGMCSWYEFATAIFTEAGIEVKVTPVETKNFPRPAQRPSFSVLDHTSIRLNGFAEFRHWKDALRDFMGSGKWGAE
ncbi:dTDP-4-dehydrorhamnose reductase [Effusibacillus lacus]|uniref:dTDP-4-dehydrorhamnose reductase n=1 Tax=Effusibacillus lacus TaxID=1348429 RepID=A0A292YSV1_9BACL|nr:dTDP-4-dehydrorhamnose reductase [Effusibacillus lacus]TCS73513.1 dTDP-4-dehydrorhamnose reductase [Effusibacillus lacus]GAX91991.1 NAD(P)-dependent oxidoreductase [Effusibacillus lacus]